VATPISKMLFNKRHFRRLAVNWKSIKITYINLKDFGSNPFPIILINFVDNTR